MAWSRSRASGPAISETRPYKKRLNRRDLAAAEMLLDHAEGERQVAVGLGLDERHLMLVPADDHRPLQRQAIGRECGEPLALRDTAVGTSDCSRCGGAWA